MRIALIGVGLIGGSVGLAAKRRIEDVRVVGYDPSPRVLAAAVRVGAIDEKAASIADAVAGADLVVLAPPMASMARVLQDVLAAAPEECAITDVGSVKRPVIAAAAGDGRLVAGHPLAGSESAGVAHARADLFDGATWYLVPHEHTQGTRFEQVHRIVSQLGARPTTIDAETHDRLMATVSHLPHVLANVLVEQVGEARGEDQPVPATGPSFRDVTRVAGANPPLWAGIYDANRDALAYQLERVIARLSDVRQRLVDGDNLQAWQAAAGEQRKVLVDRALTGDELVELRTVVPNAPGAIAQLALAFSAAGVNIADISVAPLPGGATGMVGWWVPLEQARDASAVVGELGIEIVNGDQFLEGAGELPA
jgi:prephenate dehydrogenase